MTRAPTDIPDLSIVITVVDGGTALERCLHAVAGQFDPLSMEVIVPYDHASQEVSRLADRFPAFTFVDLGAVLGGAVPRNPFDLHRFYDLRRAAALKLARGRLVGMLEDRGTPAPDWAATMLSLHDASPHAAIGGAVENGVDRIRNWAIYFCDYGRYQPPLSDDDPEYLTDVNICYKREALESVRDLWTDSYNEAQVNWALRRNGAQMMLSDRPRIVQTRRRMSVCEMASERLHWGRGFGRMRGGESSALGRLKLCLAMPALPLLLFVRHFRRQLAKGRNVKQFVLATPAIVFLLVFWAIGEFVGYLEAKPAPAHELAADA